MTKLGFVMGAMTVCAAVLVLAGPPVSSQGTNNEIAPPAIVASAAARQVHRLVLQVNSDEPEVMTLALNNAANVERYYTVMNEKVEIEIVAFGPGLHMLREDTSPVKDRIKTMADKTSSITFKACGNTQENMAKQEKKPIPLISQASVVKSGVVRVMELQEQGWSYVRP